MTSPPSLEILVNLSRQGVRSYANINEHQGIGGTPRRRQEIIYPVPLLHVAKVCRDLIYSYRSSLREKR